MALFKPLLGKRENLPIILTSGHAYFCTDDGSFWIDYTDSDGVVKRKQINAQEAEKLIGYDVTTTVANDDTTIPTSSAVFSAIEAASDHTHDYAGSSQPGGAATSADKLTTSRTIRTNLGSTSIASFNGTENITPGVTGTLKIDNGGTGATSAVDARKNLGIYVYTGYIKTSSSVSANGLLTDYVSAKTLFGFTTVPSNFAIVSVTSKSTYFSCNFFHEVGSDSITIKMRNVSGTSVSATNYYYSVIGMLI